MSQTLSPSRNRTTLLTARGLMTFLYLEKQVRLESPQGF